MSTSMFQKGDNVKIISTNKIGTVNAVVENNDKFNYKVTVDGKTYNYLEKYLDYYVDEEQEMYTDFLTSEYGNFDDYRTFQTWYRLKRPIESNIYSFLSSKTLFNPYQFKPVLKFINPDSEGRLFIADEVGVGKTIETGIILTELIARGKISRKDPVLIVCPNSLGPKWKDEMQERFNLKFYLHDTKSFTGMLKSMKDTGFVPDEYSWSIISIQSIRSEKYCEMLTEIIDSRYEPILKMVVIDESHHMRNFGTETNAIGYLLSKLTDMMIMLSATPLNLKNEDFFNQMNILNPSLFPNINTFEAMTAPLKSINRCRKLIFTRDTLAYGEILQEIDNLRNSSIGQAVCKHDGIDELEKKLKSGMKLKNEEIALYERMITSLSPIDTVFTRTLKREAIEHKVIRETNKIPVILSQEEYKFQEDFINAIKEVYLERGGANCALGFVLNMPYRMVSSCIPATRDYVNWCINNDKVTILNNNSYDVDEDSEQKMETIELSSDVKNQFIRLEEQISKISKIDTKYDELKKYLEKLLPNIENGQIIIFSFFVGTLKYLEKRLAQEGYKVGLIYGGVPVTSNHGETTRNDIIKSFKNGETDILLSSEVGGEGLDFQFCQAILNYDLPYNPMRIEQRIGRIDRFGQKADKIIATSMYIKDTVDERIYELLYERIKLVEDNIGDMESIINKEIMDLQRCIITDNLSDEEIQLKSRSIEISIEQAKIEQAKFEDNRNELLGDDSFSKAFLNMDKTDFVKPEDAVQLTKIYLRGNMGCKYDEINDVSGKLTITKDIVDKISNFTRRAGYEGSYFELGKLIEKYKNIPVIFDGNKAVENNNCLFLPPCGYWIKFILRELENSEKIKKVFKMKSINQNNIFGKGTYLIPLFEVSIEGFRRELSLKAVPVKISDRKVVECNFEDITRQFNNDCNYDYELNIDLCEEDLIECIEVSRDALNYDLDDKVANLNFQHKFKMELRIASLEKGVSKTIQKVNKKINDYIENCIQERKDPNRDFIRLEKAKMANEEKWKEEKIKSIKEKMELSVNTTVVGIVILEV